MPQRGSRAKKSTPPTLKNNTSKARYGFANYWIWHELVLSYTRLRKRSKTRVIRKELYTLGKKIVRHYIQNFLKFPIWLFKFIVPSYFRGPVTVWSNLKTIIRNPEFRPLRIAVVSQTIFLYVIVRLVVFLFYDTVLPAYTATYGWVQTSWTGGVSTSTGSHTNDRTGWTKYTSSTQVNVAISPGNVVIATSTYTTTDDGTLTTDGLASGGGFDNGTTSSVVISGSGASADVTLGVASAGGEVDTWDSVSYDLPATISGTEDGNGAMVSDGVDAFYILRGGGTTGFYKFIPSTKATSTLAAIPSIIPPNGGGGTIALTGNYIYLYSGGNSGPHFYVYNISNDSWSTLSNPPSAPYGDGIGGTMAADGSGNIYLAAGGATTGFYKYTVTSSAPTGTWSTLTAIGSSVGRGSQIKYDSANNAMLILTGNNGHTVSKYDITGDTMTNYSGAPNDPGFTSGAAMVKNDTNNTVYAISGQNYAWLERLNLTGGSWAGRQTSSTPASGATVGYMIKKSGEDRIYTTFGGTSFYYLRPSNGTWYFTTTTHPIPGSVGQGATMIRYNNDEIYVLAGGGSKAIYRFAINSGTQYTTTGTLTSATIDLKYATSTVMSWSATTPGNAGPNSVKFQVAANTDNATWSYIGPDGTSNTYFNTSSTALPGSLQGKRYYRYKAFLSTTNASYTPTLSSVTFAYQSYLTSGDLTSSAFNTLDSTNVFAHIAWTQTAPTGTSIKFQVRTSPDNSTWTSWMGPDGTTSTYFTDNTGAQNFPSAISDGSNDNWAQYKAFFISDGTATPVLQDVTLTYVVNAPPDISLVTSTLFVSSTGIVTVDYSVRDIDTDTGSTHGIVAISLQYCTANCSNSGSETWATAVTSSLTGDFGPSVSVNLASTTQYTSHSLTWTPTSSYNNQYNGSNFKIRLRADDSEAANHIGTAESSVFILDTTDPIATTTLDARSDATSTLRISVTDDTMSGLQMKLSNNSNLSADGLNANSGTWIPYTSTSTWVLGSGGTSVYYQIKDAYGNISADGAISSVTTPDIPSIIVYQDVSNADTSEWREFVAWSAINAPNPGFRQYRIYRSTDGSSYTLFSTETNRLTNYFIDANLDTNTTYYYKIASEDSNGNISNYTSVVSDRPDGQGGSDLTPPAISNVTVTNTTTQSATITWETDELADSTVDYITATGGDFSNAPSVGVSSLLDSAGSVGVHRVTLTGLTPNTTYYFQVHSVDNDGNEGTSKLDTDGYTFTTLSGPSISNVAESNILNRTVTITWNTDQASDSYVYYSTSSTVASSTLAGTADNTTSHSVTLQNLTPNTTYYFYVKSGVAEDKNVIDGVITYYNFKTTNDATNPTITFNPSTDVIASDTTLNISWTTDESATSSLEYGTSNAYGSISLNNNYNTNHTYTLTGLLPGTAYYLRIKNTDVNGNGSSATEFNATTTNSADVTPPVITFSAASDVAVSDNAVVVSWITNEIATSTLEYGTSTNYGLISANSNYNQNHSYRVSGLNSGTLYYFRIRSTDTSHNISSPIAFSTTTTNSADITPPSIVFDPNTDVTISSTTVSVTWATNEVATSSLEYGTSNSYGSISVNNNYNTDHSYTISGLTPGTLYYFRLKNADVSYNISSSTTFSTTTVSYSTDTTPPVITSVSTTAVTDDQAFIAWNTDEGATSQVYYGTTSSTYDFSSELDSTLNFTHGIVLSNLVSSTAYSYIVVSHDSSGNSSTSSEYSFMTLEKLSQESEVQLREEIARQTGVTQGQASVSSGGGGGSSIDRTAPVISGVTIPTILSDSAIITWDTSEEANAIAEFGKTLKYGQASVDLENATKHSISLVELLPFTTYFYRLSSIDTTGNRSTYATGSFTTLSLEQEIASSTENSVEQPTSTAQEPDKASEDIFLSTIEKAGEILKTLANRVSVGVLESSLLGQQKIIEQLSSILPLPIIGGQPVVEVGSNYANISWTTDKQSNSLVDFSPENLFSPTRPYDQTIGDPYATTLNHEVSLKGLAPDTVYHYRVISRTQTGSETKSQDFTFKTKPESNEITNYKIDKLSGEAVTFSWITSVPADSIITYIPYRNGVPVAEARQTVKENGLTTQHSLKVSGFEGGVLYDIEISGADTGNNIASKVIKGFSTEGEDSAPIISQVQTDSAIIPGDKERIQVIISWNTNELSTSRLYYRKGFALDGSGFDVSTTPDFNYTKKHIVVVTNFEPGTVYQFVAESVDSSGNVGKSNTVTILTPQKEQSVFQVILSNVESMFSWVGKIRN